MNDPRLLQLLPHRPPMLLLSRLVEVANTRAAAEVDITPQSAFFESGKGVPAWIGVEYMGQTAALIAGLQLQTGAIAPHIGLLLGTRKYTAQCPWFQAGAFLLVTCTELAVVGDGLATFACQIQDRQLDTTLASAQLSVYRRPVIRS